MKKVVARVTLGLFVAVSFCLFGWQLIINPCVNLYSKYGLLGFAAWVVALGLLFVVFAVIVKVVEWAIENS